MLILLVSKFVFFYAYSCFFFILDFYISNDERIRGYMNSYDWRDELKDANETQWIVDKTKFDSRSFVKEYEI